MAEPLHTSTAPYSGSGYPCGTCGVFVPDGMSHACTGRTQWTTQPPLQMFWPCNGVANHDFAVGPTHAVCNRCEKKVKLDD